MGKALRELLQCTINIVTLVVQAQSPSRTPCDCPGALRLSPDALSPEAAMTVQLADQLSGEHKGQERIGVAMADRC